MATLSDNIGGDTTLSKLFAEPKTDQLDESTSASRTANNSPVTVTIDPGGDLYLIAGGELADVIITRFRVCSTTLARHSRVFKTMLFGNFAESKSKNKWGQDWEVALPEEKPEAMEVILTIAHAYFNKVPEIVTADYFCHILMVTNKYDLSPILKFSALSWFRHLGNLSSLIKTGEGASEFLYIALELGFEALYKWLIEKLAKITSIDSSGKLKIGRKDHVLLDLEYIPDCAQVHIKEYRHALLKRLLNTLWSCWKALDSEWTISFETGYTRVWHPILCRSRHADARSCEAAASRCIHISLMRAGHWPLGSFNEYLKTPRALKTILAIDWSAGGTPEDRNMSYHPVCGRAEKYKPLLERAWKYTPVLDNEYQEHFAKQGERTGFAGRGIKELTSDD